MEQPEPDAPAGDTHHRLPIEFNEETWKALSWLAPSEKLNVTTVTNRAVQVYAVLREVQDGGGRVFVEEPGTTELKLLRPLAES